VQTAGEEIDRILLHLWTCVVLCLRVNVSLTVE